VRTYCAVGIGKIVKMNSFLSQMASAALVLIFATGLLVVGKPHIESKPQRLDPAVWVKKTVTANVVRLPPY